MDIISSESGFSYLGLSDELLRAVSDAGYQDPTPIQRGAIPVVLQGRDVLGIAQTGTGKTASFTLPLIDVLAQGRNRARMPRSLILEPTRELAAQVAESFDKYGKNHGLTKALLIGGVAFGEQDKLLARGVDVLIATPGRLLDQCSRGKVMLSGAEILVIDEADRMLDMGFIPDIEKIRKMMPQRLQTLFFSATMPPPIKALCDQFLIDPKTVEVSAPASTATTVEQSVSYVAPRQKRSALRAILRDESIQNAIVFCNRKRDVKTLYESMKRHDFSAQQLHGDMQQSERMSVLKAFKANEIQILLASDVAARGLDIPTVSHVVNFDIPNNPDDYVHRIGRTGRAGRPGRAFLLATAKEREAVAAIEALIGKDLVEYEVPGVSSERRNGTEETSEKEPGQRDDERPSRRRRSKNSQANRGEHATQRNGAEQDARASDQSRSSSDLGSSERKEPARSGRSGRGRQRDKDEKPVVGMGDHVPAFMMREFKTKKTA
ncbi:MAG: DEAD/DEAH box helicase [Pseudomonadota bacterium]